jgi:hypothetical protein
VLRKQSWTALTLVAVAALIHITTALWFAIVIGTALIVADRGLRPVLLGGVLLVAVAGMWAITAGPLAGALVRIDPAWREVLATKDTLFAHEWPLLAWLANIGTAVVLGWAWWYRRQHGITTGADSGLAAGAAALLVLFFVTLPLTAAGIWLFVELQISRVFWLIDFLATIYLVAAIERRFSAHRAITYVVMALIAFSVARGAYILWIERPERSLFAFDLPASPWTDAMRWLQGTPVHTHVLADPGHAFRYGSSVRVAAARDLFHEEVKDSALAIYSRAVAMRVRERHAAVADFHRLTAEQARALATRYHLDYLVIDRALDLPVAHRNRQFTVYLLSGGYASASAGRVMSPMMNR